MTHSGHMTRKYYEYSLCITALLCGEATVMNWIPVQTMQPVKDYLLLAFDKTLPYTVKLSDVTLMLRHNPNVIVAVKFSLYSLFHKR